MVANDSESFLFRKLFIEIQVSEKEKGKRCECAPEKYRYLSEEEKY